MILAAVYLLRFYAKAMFGKGNDEVLSQVKDLSTSEFIVMGVLSILVILMGIFPQPVLDMVNSSVEYIYLALIKKGA